jgi:2-methylcitrate dehydratase PrpD
MNRSARDDKGVGTNGGRIVESHEPLAVRMARAVVSADQLPASVIDKTRVCLLDLIGCAFESRALPWSRQAVSLAFRAAPGTAAATIIGSPDATSCEDAAFANAVMGHGLVREDMHPGSVSHLGIVVLPVLLALSQRRPVRGRDLIAAAMVGYEVGGQIGRALMDPDIARLHRPTGLTGPIAAAAAAARLLGLDAEQTTSALALAANAAAGQNQWAHTGGSEMFFHAGFAARNALTAARLAEAGAFASPSALDGEAGLFAAFRKRSAASSVALFRGEPEILSVYHKPVPACNFAQTPCQAALAIAREARPAPDRIAAISIRVPRAGAMYPGCDYTGPFAHVLQAKMSIQYNVAAALIAGGVSEENFALPGDPALNRLIGLTTLEIDDEMTSAYPGLQGGEVVVRDSAGAVHRARLDNVVNASAVDVRARFRVAASAALGAGRAKEIEDAVDDLEHSADAGKLAGLLGAARGVRIRERARNR